MTLVSLDNLVFLVSTFAPERPGKIADRLDCTYGHKKNQASKSQSQEKSTQESEQKEEFYHLNNSLYLFVK
jgi:hypothetical protein